MAYLLLLAVRARFSGILILGFLLIVVNGFFMLSSFPER